MRPAFYFMLIGLLLLSACTRKPRMLDYISLPPPGRVTAKWFPDKGILVQWKAPPHYILARIADYLVFMSDHSLVYTSIRDLPPPAKVVARQDTACWLEVPAGADDLFLHVRSRSMDGDLSLPSLPEIHLKIPSK